MPSLQKNASHHQEETTRSNPKPQAKQQSIDELETIGTHPHVTTNDIKDRYETKYSIPSPLETPIPDHMGTSLQEDEIPTRGQKIHFAADETIQKMFLEDVANQDKLTTEQQRSKWLPHLNAWSDQNIDVMALLQSVMFKANESVRQDVIRVARRMEYFNLLRSEIRKELQLAQKHLSRDVEQRLQLDQPTNKRTTKPSPSDAMSHASAKDTLSIKKSNTDTQQHDESSQQKQPSSSNDADEAPPHTKDTMQGNGVLNIPYQSHVFDLQATKLDLPNRESLRQPGEIFYSRTSLENHIKNLEQQLNTVGDDAQLTYLDLQMKSQQQQQQLSLISNTSKAIHELHMSIIRKIGN